MSILSRRISTLRAAIRHHETGTIIRNHIHRISVTISPYVKVIIPNFRVAHYFYILSMVIIGSILIYPVKNIKYIDALFLASGASTQAGLNTVNINEISLYQQIIIYVVTCFTTPIFIHGSLLFVRLYYFERHFDNIKEKSKLNFKMRRSATLAARTHSIDPLTGPTQKNTVSNQGLGFMSNYRDNYQQNDNNFDQISSALNASSKDTSEDSSSDKILHESQPSDDTTKNIDTSPSVDNDGIKFGNLPQPSKTRKKEVDPSDMYRSIAMLQDHQKYRDHMNDEDDVLIIRSPNEIENDSNKPIFTSKSQIHFQTSETPKKPKKSNRKRGGKLRKKRAQWSKLKRSFSNTSNYKHRKKHSDPNFNEEDSIDSEMENEGNNTFSEYGLTSAVLEDDENAVLNDEDEDEDDEDDSDDNDEDEDIMHSDDDNDIGEGDEDEVDSEDDDNFESIKKAQSNLALPSIDATGGKKFSKRSNSLDVLSKSDIVKSPTFDKLLGMRRKKNKNRAFSFNKTLSPTRTNYDDEEQLGDGHSLKKVMSTSYLSWVPTVGRNSTFVLLTDEQKEELGGVEYRAVKLLIKIIVLYYIGFHIIAMVLLLPWVLNQSHYVKALRDQGLAPTWWAFFTGQSAFNDLGLTLTKDSMSTFSESYFVMLVMSFFIVIGNTGFPIALRFIIWVLFKLAKPLSLFEESLGFLLDHPRRCFTLLFPSIPTWWLFFILIVLNVVDLILFIVLDLHNGYLSDIPTSYRIVEGLFQAFSTRTAGFSVIDLSKLHPAIQVSYMLMMYISVLPLAISIRRTNVYEEQSLGVYLKDENENEQDLEKTPKSFIGAHLRNQLSFDLWFIFLGLFIICLAEGPRLKSENVHFTVFTVLFEIISAYGTVGLSLGYPNTYTSFSYKLTTLSRLVIIAMMIRGRHRGLPYTLDRAIMLPDDDMLRRDKVQENHAIRRNTTVDNPERNQDGNTLRRMMSRWQSTRESSSRRPSQHESLGNGNSNNREELESFQMNNLKHVA